MTSPKRLARTAGLCYLIVIVSGVFAHLFVRATVHVPGDAAATAGNILANAGLFRAGFVADLVMATSFLFLAMALYMLLRHVDDNVARAMVVFVAISVAILCLNMLNHFGALTLATDGSYGALGADGTDALVLFLVDMHEYGYLIAQIFFGLWLLPLGYLAYRSGMFPRTLGVLLVVACFGHLLDMLARFLVPDVADTIGPLLTAASISELWMAGYLLTKGVKTTRPDAPVPAAATTPPATVN
jgi:hypothetical protein